jgi:hypothetical protein
VLGFVPGADRKLVEWPSLVAYYRRLGATSRRVQYRELGKTTNGAPFVALVISSPANMARLDQIRDVNAKLADPRLIASPAERARLIRDGKAVVLITSSIHSTEVGGHMTPVLLAYQLATDTASDIQSILDQTIVLLVPSLNPDGVTIVARWYNQTLGTPAEGSNPPELYHHYTGHDNNRDWYAFTQIETQLTVDSLHSVWHPQIVHDIHQQGSNGSRLFLPPYLDPVEPNVDPLLVAGVNALGSDMAWQLMGEGKRGVVINSTYDAWTPARAYQHYHGGVRILQEAASAQLATPIEIRPEQLGQQRGFDAGKSSWNFPAPWPGGRWTIGDIVAYQTSAALALLRNAAANRATWLSNFVAVEERAVRGWDGWPFAYLLPRDGQDQAALNTLLGILHRGQVEIRTATAPFVSADVRYPAGTYVVTLRQPYAAFAKTLLERQRYPNLLQYPGGPPQPPYDVTANTLPLLMGVQSAVAEREMPVALSPPATTMPPAVYRFAGLSDQRGPRARRIGLYRSYTGPIDEGWTRWVFDTWHIPYVSIEDSAVRGGGLRRRFDVIVLPDMSDRAIAEGLPSRYPAPYAGGLGNPGAQALAEFVNGGGTLIALNQASSFAIRALQLPVRNVLEGVRDQDFYAPGSIFQLELDSTASIATAMPRRTIAWFEGSPAFAVTDSTRVRILGRYPADPAAVLLSGWVLHPERVAGRAALLEATMGRGRVILFGFRPQYRGQSLATYPLLFNALLAAGH